VLLCSALYARMRRIDETYLVTKYCALINRGKIYIIILLYFVIIYFTATMPADKRTPLQCRKCFDKSERGESVRKVVFLKLAQHLRQEHGYSATQASQTASRARARVSTRGTGSNLKSSSGQPYYVCLVNGYVNKK